MRTALERVLADIGQLPADIGRFLDGQYHRRPGCCASAGLTLAQMEGVRHAENDPAPDHPTESSDEA